MSTTAIDPVVERVGVITSPLPVAPVPVEDTWQKVKLARHPERPHTHDYISRLFSGYIELHGDRRFGDDQALIGGLACFEGRNVVVMGQQKGKDTRDNIKRNFGMPCAEGYRKALRLFRLGEKFGFPIICFIDTPGAYPGLQSEERGVAQAIAENLLVLAALRVPVIATIIGEGGSGGALAIGLADRVLMLENSIYSVASPEASAAILWHDASLASEAATSMKVAAPQILQMGLIDEVIQEPDGGAHTNPSESAGLLKAALLRNLEELEFETGETNGGIDGLLEKRYWKFRSMGAWQQA